MISFREESQTWQEEALQAANRRLLEMRERRQALREKAEKANCAELGREPGAVARVKFGKLLKTLVREIRASLPVAGKKSELLAAWQEVGGEAIAASTVGVELRNGFLNVVMDNHILKHEIESFRHEQLLADVRRRLAGTIIRGIRVKIGNKQ